MAGRGRGGGRKSKFHNSISFPSAIISQMKDILLKLACRLVLVSLKVIYNLEDKKKMPSKREKKKNLKTYQRERLRDLL